jgi:hypothetical protein
VSEAGSRAVTVVMGRFESLVAYGGERAEVSAAPSRKSTALRG